MVHDLTIEEAKPQYYVEDVVLQRQNGAEYTVKNFTYIGDKVTLSDGHVVTRSKRHRTISVVEPWTTVERYKDLTPTGAIEHGHERCGGMSESQFRDAYKHCQVFVDLCMLGFLMARIKHEENEGLR